MVTVILAGGQGTRLTSAPPGLKPLTKLGNLTLLEHAINETRGVGDTLLVIVNPDVRANYEDYIRDPRVEVVPLRQPTPSRAVGEVLELGAEALVLHSDEVCVGGIAHAYLRVAARTGLPAVGLSSPAQDSGLDIRRISSLQAHVDSDGRIKDREALTPEARFIGRYAFTMDRTTAGALKEYPSVLQALIASHMEIVGVGLPMTYFDCGTDETIADSRRRFGEIQA